MSQGVSRTPTVSISFRVDKNLADRIRKYASDQQIGLNTLVSQLFRQYLDWYQNAGKAGFTSAPRILLTAILENYTEEELDEFAKNLVEEAFVETHVVLYGEASPQAVFSIIESWAKTSQFLYRYERKENLHNVFVQHDLGNNWSYLLSKIWEIIFSKLGAKGWKSRLTSRSVWFSVELPHSV